jgi:hypothetical protein
VQTAAATNRRFSRTRERGRAKWAFKAAQTTHDPVLRGVYLPAPTERTSMTNETTAILKVVERRPHGIYSHCYGSSPETLEGCNET